MENRQYVLIDLVGVPVVKILHMKKREITVSWSWSESLTGWVIDGPAARS